MISVAGIVKKGTADTPFTFPLPNGTYSFSIAGLDPGYRADPANGTFVVSGPPKHPEFPIVIQIIGPPGPWGPFGLGLLGYGLVGGIVAAALLAFWFWRRRRTAPVGAESPTPPPAETRPKKRRSKRKGGYVPPDSI